MTAAFDLDDPIYGIPPDLVEYDEPVLASSETWHLPRDIWRPIRKKNQGEGVKVAILDTGRYDHPSLPTPYMTRNYIRGENADDRNEHSTHCRGTIGSSDEDIGVAPKAEQGVYKVLSNSGSGSSSGIARAINDAVDDGADILSLSLGGGNRYEPTITGIKRAFARGVIVCCANGNAGFNGRNNTIGYPARSGESVAVAALNSQFKPAQFSSGGEQTTIAAPGERILSCSIDPSAPWTFKSGTSMATPFAAGCFALILSEMRKQGRSSMTSVEAVHQFVKLNSTDLLSPGHDHSTGFGMFDMTKVIKALGQGDLKFS